MQEDAQRERTNLAEGVERAIGGAIGPSIHAAQERLMEALPHVLPALEWVGEEMERPEFKSWMLPLEGPSRAVGSLIQGGNLGDMLEAAGSQDFTMDETGRMQNVAPLVSEALAERGVHPILAGMAEFLVPDPTGARKVTDLIPLFALIGPAGLRALAQEGGGISFMPASILAEAAGNPPRRSPAQQSAFRRALDAPGGIEEAAIVIYDPQTMRWKVGEGNHRVLAALEADSPVPTRVVRGTVRENEGLTIPPEGVQGLERLMEARHGYTPGSGYPSEIGLPTYDLESMMRFAQTRADRLDISEQEIVEAVGILEEMFSAAAGRPFEQTGRVLSRVPEQVPDFTPTLQRLMRSMGREDTSPGAVESFVDEVYSRFGKEGGDQFFETNAGLSPIDMEMMRARWATTVSDANELTGLTAARRQFDDLASGGADIVSTRRFTGMDWTEPFLNDVPSENLNPFRGYIEESWSLMQDPTNVTWVTPEDLTATIENTRVMRQFALDAGYDASPVRRPFLQYLDEVEDVLTDALEIRRQNDPSSTAAAARHPVDAAFDEAANQGAAIVAGQERELTRAVQDAAADFAIGGGLETLLQEASEAVEILRAGGRGEDTLRHAMMVRDELSDGMASLMAHYRTKGNMPPLAERAYNKAEAARWSIIEAFPDDLLP